MPKRKKDRANRNKARLKVARIHARIADRRRDFLQKLSTRLIRENQTICVESLAVKNMVKHKKLSKAIHDVRWSAFVAQLEYKAQWYGRTLVKIDRWYPSSKRCFDCGICSVLSPWISAGGRALNVVLTMIEISTQPKCAVSAHRRSSLKERKDENNSFRTTDQLRGEIQRGK